MGRGVRMHGTLRTRVVISDINDNLKIKCVIRLILD